jgi:hypothetical protein
MLDLLPRRSALDPAIAGALALAAGAIARLDQALALHPLLPAFLHRARLRGGAPPGRGRRPGAATLRPDTAWARDAWVPAFLTALAGEAADGLQLLMGCSY